MPFRSGWPSGVRGVVEVVSSSSAGGAGGACGEECGNQRRKHRLHPPVRHRASSLRRKFPLRSRTAGRRNDQRYVTILGHSTWIAGAPVAASPRGLSMHRRPIVYNLFGGPLGSPWGPAHWSPIPCRSPIHGGTSSLRSRRGPVLAAEHAEHAGHDEIEEIVVTGSHLHRAHLVSSEPGHRGGTPRSCCFRVRFVWRT